MNKPVVVTTKESPNGLLIYVNGELYVKAPSIAQVQNEEIFEKFLTAAQLLFAENKPMDVVARKFMAACQARRGGVEFNAAVALKELEAAAAKVPALGPIKRRNGSRPPKRTTKKRR